MNYIVVLTKKCKYKILKSSLGNRLINNVLFEGIIGECESYINLIADRF